MLGSKKTNRYNAYMKRTKSGIIVKTVDSGTGFESLIKFTSDSFMLPKETFGDNCSKEFVKPTMNKSIQDIPNVNRKQYSLIKKNPKIISKLSHLRPYLRELQPKIPGFNVYEDSSSTSDFQNPNVIFVANSKLAKDNVINLSIPGKLRNVCYKGVLNENNLVKFKAESVIKPLTIVVGDYVININICHDLTSGKNVEDSSKLQHNDDVSLSCCRSQSLNLLCEDQCIEIREACIDSITNDINSSKCIKDCNIETNDKTPVISESSISLEPRISDVTSKSVPRVKNNEKGNILESLGNGSESSIFSQSSCIQTECSVTRRSSDESTSNENIYFEEINQTKSSSKEDLAVSNENDVSENSIETTVMHPSNCHTPPNGMSFKEQKTSKNHQLPISDSLSPVSNNYMFSGKSNKIKTGKNTHSVVGVHSSRSFVKNSIETMPIGEFENGLACTEEKRTKPNGRCSNISLQQIKRRLSEATTSLHELCSVIESINNFSEKSVSNETLGKTQVEEMTFDKLNNITESDETIQGGANEMDSNSSINVAYHGTENSRSDDSCPSNEITAKRSYTVGDNQLEIKKPLSLQLKPDHETADGNIFVPKEIDDPFSDKCVASVEQSNCLAGSLSGRNPFGEINDRYSLSRTKIEHKSYNTINMKLLCHCKRQAKSLTNLCELNRSSIDNIHKTGVNCNHLTKTTPHLLCRRKFLNQQTYEPNRIAFVSSIKNDYSSKANGGSMIIRGAMKSPPKLLNDHDNVASESGKRVRTTCMRGNQELEDESDLGHETQLSDPRMNCHSINSLRTIYIKSDCASSNVLTVPVQHPSMKTFKHNKDPTAETTNNVSFSNLKFSFHKKLNKNSCKSFGKRFKQNLIRFRKELWSFGTSKSSKMKISSLSQYPVNNESKGLGMVSKANNTIAESEEQLACIPAETESFRYSYLNFDHNSGENDGVNDQGSSKTISDTEIQTLRTMGSSQNRGTKGMIINPKTLNTSFHRIIDPTVEQSLQMSYPGCVLNPQNQIQTYKPRE